MNVMKMDVLMKKEEKKGRKEERSDLLYTSFRLQGVPASYSAPASKTKQQSGRVLAKRTEDESMHKSAGETVMHYDIVFDHFLDSTSSPDLLAVA